jgi:hypothetical protein
LRAIEKKVKKRYTRTRTTTLWLVVYHNAIFGVPNDDEAPIDECRRLLERSKHPFEEVWYFRPLPYEAFGTHPVQLWPKPSASLS